MFSLTNVSVSLKSEAGLVSILNALSLTLNEGEVFGVVGPSGSGKSVLLKVMAGLWEPDSGEVRFQGQDLFSLSRTRHKEFFSHLGMTFQKSGLLDSLTSFENLDFALKEGAGVKKASDRVPRVQKALLEVGLEGSEQLYPHELSGGMQKRLGIARALVLKPECLLYDDPTAGLDPITSRQILKLILKAKAQNKMTVVLVTSEVDLAFKFCNRIGFLYEGRFIEVGTPAELKASRHPVLQQFFSGNPNGPLTA